MNAPMSARLGDRQEILDAVRRLPEIDRAKRWHPSGEQHSELLPKCSRRKPDKPRPEAYGL